MATTHPSEASLGWVNLEAICANHFHIIYLYKLLIQNVKFVPL